MVNSGRVVVKRDEDSVAVERRVWSQISHLNKLFNFLNFGFLSKIKFIIAPTLLFYLFLKILFIYFLGFFFFPFIFISWRLITSQHCSGFCPTLT